MNSQGGTMEKQPTYDAGDAAPRPSRKRHAFPLVKGLTIAVICFLAVASWRRGDMGRTLSWNQPTDTTQTTTDFFDWDTLAAKTTLEYTACYDDKHQCARLELPMDYWNGTTNATIGLAVIRRPAKVPVTHPQYGGAVLLNPGGPGGSGVGFLLRAGPHISDVIDSKDGKYFDLISFDPRTVSFTKPATQCFDNLRLREAWNFRILEEGIFSSSDAAFGRLWSMAIARGQSCSLPLSTGEPDLKKYASTASVARDMIELVEKHGEWREKEAKHLFRLQDNCYARKTSKLSKTSVDALETLKYDPGNEKIQYWGFSYGSYLGNTFTAMFPNRIHRLIVDGVVDAYDYREALWMDSLMDTEKDMNLFYYHCARAGYPACALANVTGSTTAEGVKQRMKNITTSLYHNPLPVIGRNPEVITYSDVKHAIFSALYAPIESFPHIADILAAIERGDGSEFAKLVEPNYTPESSRQTNPGHCALSAPLHDRSQSQVVGSSDDSQMIIACTDGDSQGATTKQDFADHVKRLTELSPSIGEIWSTIRLDCIHFDLRPYYRFEDDWKANTSHPILEIGNTADPVTPGRFAKKMAKGFTGAVALMQDSGGHCSISVASNCTESYIRQYFQTGMLPPEDTVCGVDVMPFGSGSSEGHLLDSHTLKVIERQKGIARALHQSGGGFLRFQDAWLNL